MKRLLIIFAAAVMAVNIVAQDMPADNPNTDPKNKVTGVAGVQFGDSKAKAKRILNSRSQRIYSLDRNKLDCYNIEIGGFCYNHATFDFEPGKGLVSVYMEISTPTWKKEEAIMLYRAIVYSYAAKYSNLVELADGEDAKVSVCGAFDENYFPGMGIRPITIFFQKGMSRDGNMFYYIVVSYFGSRNSTPPHDDI